jgi:peroxin-14
MSQPPRQDLIQNAILFLQDPKTQSSPLTSKIEFLQAKGLNESEIQDALSRSTSSSSTVSRSIPQEGGGYGGGGYGMRYEMAPVPPKRDWRDLFVCPPFHYIVICMYMMLILDHGSSLRRSCIWSDSPCTGKLAHSRVWRDQADIQKYLVPHLQPPSTTAFQQTSAEITSQYDEAAKLLQELQEQTSQLQTTLDGDRYESISRFLHLGKEEKRMKLIYRERVNKVVNDVEEAVVSVREAEESWRGEMREIRGEVESVRELVPRVSPPSTLVPPRHLDLLKEQLYPILSLSQSRRTACLDEES